MLYDPKWQVNTDAVSAHCLRAAEYIEKHGWCQGTLLTADGQVCLMGALAMTNPYGHIAILDSWSVIRSRIGAVSWNEQLFKATQLDAWRRICMMVHTDPPQWNDAKYRTKEQVVGLLRAAAEVRDVNNIKA